MTKIAKNAAKEQAIAELAQAICWGETYTSDDEARNTAEHIWQQNFAAYGFWPAVGQCEIRAARYRDM